MTRVGVDRILDYAFKLAQSRPRKLLTSASEFSRSTKDVKRLMVGTTHFSHYCLLNSQE